VVELSCPVRGCGRVLAVDERGARCEAGHAFDRARSGYLNLGGASDTGDARAIVAARRRTLDRGLADALRDALLARLARLELAPGDGVLDAGCGEGTFLGAIASRFPIDGWGVDLSVAAVDAAARRHRHVHFVVANVDRRLPFRDGSFRVILSILGRKNPAEFARVLAAGGRVVLVVPAADDQAELREAMLGRVVDKGWADKTAEAFADRFAVIAGEEVRQRARLDRDALVDLVDGTYRGGRRRARERLVALDAMEVTSAWRILELDKAC
jgi:23S rRNA (guanine745-N1)-methyltransferase